MKFLITANPARGQHPWYQISFSEAWEMDLNVFDNFYTEQRESLQGMYAKMKSSGG